MCWASQTKTLPMESRVEPKWEYLAIQDEMRPEIRDVRRGGRFSGSGTELAGGVKRRAPHDETGSAASGGTRNECGPAHHPCSGESRTATNLLVFGLVDVVDCEYFYGLLGGLEIESVLVAQDGGELVGAGARGEIDLEIIAAGESGFVDDLL